MLGQVRNALKGIVAWFVIVLLILAFAAFGVPEIRSFTQQAPLRVGSEGFSNQEILQAFNREVTSRRFGSENGYTREDAIRQGLPAQIVSQMATRSAMEQEAKAMGLAMPRDVVSNFLQTDERYKNPRSGKFDYEYLTGILTSYNMTPAEFEEILQSDLQQTQLVSSIAQGPGAPANLVRNLILREFEKRNVTYLTVTQEMAGIAKEPTPDDLKTYYETNLSSFMAPEYRTFTAVTMRNSDFRDEDETTDDKLRAYYDANKARLYERPERRTVYQITYDTEDEAAAAVASLNDDEPFEKLAENRGLPLDAVTFPDVTKSDLLDPKVGDAVFSEDASEGTVAGPIAGLFGFTVAQVAAITPAEIQNFEDVREQIKDQLATGEERKKLFDTVEALETARDTGANLTDAAKSVGVEAIEFGPVDSFSFGPGGEIVDGIDGEVLREAFELEEGDESQAIAFEDDSGYFFVTVSAITAPAPTPYDTVLPEVEQRWRNEERENRLNFTQNQVRDAVAGGATLAEAAEPFNRQPITDTIDRSPQNAFLSRALVDQVFTAEKGDVVSGPAGDERVVVVINDIEFAVENAVAAQEFALRQTVGAQIDRELVDAYMAAVRDDIGIRTNQAAIDSLFSEGQ